MIGRTNAGGKPEEEKTVTAGTSAVEVTPSTGKTMKKVTVNPTPSQSKEVTPTTSKQTVLPDDGKLLDSVVVNGLKIPTGISVTTPPTKAAYKAGETINLSGMVVKASYSDGTEADVTSQCTYSPSAGTTVYESTTAITVSWVWNNITYTVTQAITVTRVLSSISITTQPSKTSYYKGDTLDLSGMVVKATFNSGATEDITSLCTTSPASGATLSTLGTQTVTVSYTENGVTKTATFAVTVNVKTVAWATGTDAEIAAMVEAADAGLIDLTDYWAVGQERSVSLSAMSATGVGESHAAQTATLVLMDKTCTGFTLATATSGGKTKPSFIVGLKNSLAETGYMNSSSTNTNGWSGSKRRTWCNDVFRPAIPSALRGIFKQFKWKQGKGSGNTSGLLETTDYFGLAPEKAVFGSQSYSFSDEAALYSQWAWYQTSANRIKKLGDSGSADYWWECSPYSGNSGYFCSVNSDGNASRNIANSAHGLAPFGCI